MGLLAKYVLFCANFIFMLASLTLIGLGAAVVAHTAELKVLMPIATEAIPVSVIILGVLVFIISCFGYCGSIHENRFLLLVYSLCTLLLAGGKIYLAIVIYNSVNRMAELVLDWLGQAFNNNQMREPFHAMEAAFRCCGTTGPDSYTSGVLPSLPVSCCPEDDQICNTTNAYDGCNRVVTVYMETYGLVLGGIMVMLIVVELSASLFGMILCCWIGNKRHRTV
ncbi:23 kDa integral membrane protein-like [Zerene cesonia]|uniref:23 kDa integral membrane protein-like n=1 Tax=Zerene cesonia TaxID=33412 RepID=UPI0018E4DFF4|nr:23 kDa integral membrane protein-like [Zerene cesonia]